MNHQKIYESIIQKAKSENRVKLRKNRRNYVYYENHHIIPRCVGGNDDKENLVLLTAREHFVCHKLLTYIYKNNRKIALAFFLLTHDNRDRKLTSKDYEYAKILLSTIGHTDETKQRISNSLKGKKLSKDLCEKRSKLYKEKEINKGDKNPMYKVDPWNKGKTGVYSPETINKLKKPKSEEHKAKLRKPKSEEHKANLRKPNNKTWVCNKNLNISMLINKTELTQFLLENEDFVKGRIISESQKQKQSIAMKGKIPWNKNKNKNKS